ncbi:CIA30 family protein [Leptolyngbya sp. CCNP1308]|uniref:CIA30 family protein n=1 Tax=Leptolyngbya sp. CCNP1308 TaxID=3110255 RepID=UPI002B1FEBF2|nr:CIA30 family protein [Leptolyngbya sp. CCNP1308]MEA5448126.1 CIA30 family protein [Leptolyngbya sp. CCNP1308]
MTETLDTSSLVPAPPKQRLWLLAEAAEKSPALIQGLAALGYGVTTETLEPDQALVNIPLVVCDELGIKSLLEQLQHRMIYQQAILIEFRQPDPAVEALWGSLDDGVMGGVSTSQVQWQEGLRFVGKVSTANSGGFASIRTRNIEPPLNLGQWQGTVLQVQGDGQRYKWILRDDSGWDSLAYCRSFDTDTTLPSLIRTSFREMVATRRARTVPDASPLNPTQLYSMQLMLSKFEYDGELNPAFNAGSFGLTVQSLGVYRQGPKPVVVILQGTEDLSQPLAEAGLTGVIPQGQEFAVIGANKNLPPEVNPAAINTIFEILG